MVIYF